jgi:pyruvate formate-lyase activating enzyme-like uncharacterized protein
MLFGETSTEVEEMIYTSPLNMTRGNLVRSLAARAAILDWETGVYDCTDSTSDLVEKRKRRREICIDMAIEHNLVTQFTSFVAIEEREEHDESERGRKRAERKHEDIEKAFAALTAKESVDELDYMDWQSTKAPVTE